MKNLINLAAQQLSKSEMLYISGGVSKEKYCQDMADAWEHNADDWDAGTVEGWWAGWSQYCA